VIKWIWEVIIRYLFHLFAYLSGKPMMPHLFCYQGFAVDNYAFTLDAADMGHPRLSINRGKKSEKILSYLNG
jgi:hypothetical protein